MIDGIKIITVVGLGVIGGSYALALSKAGYVVYGVDKDKDTLSKAVSTGAVVKSSDSCKEFFGESDVIVMALYPDMIAKYLRDNAAYVKKGAIITDVAGLKSHFACEIESTLPDGVDFVFAHPMAGREKKGFDFADDRVFKGANFIITPTAKTNPAAMEKITLLAKEIGFGQIKITTPDKHDEIIAYTSQLPHALAVALINSDSEDGETGKFIGDSYRDLTRIANINEKLWSQLFINNKVNLLDKIEEFEAQLDLIKKCVKEGNSEELEELFAKATARRINLQK
ncbi:MAG: prephenate dehydrogenase [Christensenellales bacterium]